MTLKMLLKGDDSLSSSEKKKREIVMYIFFGILTTAVSYISFIVLDVATKGFEWRIYRIDALTLFLKFVAWTLAVLFAFFTNRSFVFQSKGPIAKELIAFISSRILTLVVFELGLFQLLIWILEGGVKIDKDQMIFQISGFVFSDNQ